MDLSQTNDLNEQLEVAPSVVRSDPLVASMDNKGVPFINRTGQEMFEKMYHFFEYIS